MLRQVASLLRGIDTSLGLLQCELRVAHVEADGLFLLLEVDLPLPVFEHSAELVGLGLAVAQVDLKVHSELVFGRRVVECIRKHVTESRRKNGSALSGGEVAAQVLGAGSARTPDQAVDIQ